MNKKVMLSLVAGILGVHQRCCSVACFEDMYLYFFESLSVLVFPQYPGLQQSLWWAIADLVLADAPPLPRLASPIHYQALFLAVWSCPSNLASFWAGGTALFCSFCNILLLTKHEIMVVPVYVKCCVLCLVWLFLNCSNFRSLSGMI